MTAPGHCFGAHDRRATLSRSVFYFIHDAREFFLEHEIGVSAKGCDSPAAVRRIGRWFAKAAEVAAPEIIDAGHLECSTEGISVEMGQPAGSWPAANIAPFPPFQPRSSKCCTQDG